MRALLDEPLQFIRLNSKIHRLGLLALPLLNLEATLPRSKAIFRTMSGNGIATLIRANFAPATEKAIVRIEGVDGLAPAELIAEINRGGRFVFFEYCISLLVFTLRRPSAVVFLRADQSGWLRGLPYTLVSLGLGWWGLPWGVIYTPLCLANNLAGGCDVTLEACESLGIPVKEAGSWVDG